jgi:hypothetical protein
MSSPASTTFWSLIDRWRVSDEQALELISYEGKLPTTGRRPRFRLSAKQALTVSTMLEIDSALAAAGIDPAWLHRRSDQMPRSPLDLMRSGAMDEVLRSLTQATLQASVARAGRAKRSPRQSASGSGRDEHDRRHPDLISRDASRVQWRWGRHLPVLQSASRTSPNSAKVWATTLCQGLAGTSTSRRSRRDPRRAGRGLQGTAQGSCRRCAGKVASGYPIPSGRRSAQSTATMG